MLNQRVARSIVVKTGSLMGAGPAATLGRSRSRKDSGLMGAGRLGLALLVLLVLFPRGAQASGPRAYITNAGDGTVSVIDTASHTVTATVTVGAGPVGVAVTPDGAHVYVSNSSDNTVSVIDTATKTVATTVPVGSCPEGVAVSPDGAHAYVLNAYGNSVSVIATTTNKVTATVPVGNIPEGVAVTPDGAHVYVANAYDNTVSVIETAGNTVTAMVTVGAFPTYMAVTPDGAHVYVTNKVESTVSVIGTATNTVTTTVTVGANPIGVAATPDGASIYVSNSSSNSVSVIDTASNIVTATVAVGGSPFAFGQFIVGAARTAPTVPFRSLTARVEIKRSHKLTMHAGDSFELHGHGVLGQASDGIAPHAEAVTLSLGSLSLTVPAGSFVKKMDTDEGHARTDRDRDDGDRHAGRRDRDDRDDGDRHAGRHDRDDRITTYHFKGVIAGVSLSAEIEQGPKHSFRFEVEGRNADLSLVVNPVTVALAIGNDAGHVVVKADIDR